MAELFHVWAVSILAGFVGGIISRRLERKRCVNLLRRRVAYANPASKFTLLQAIQEINNG